MGYSRQFFYGRKICKGMRAIDHIQGIFHEPNKMDWHELVIIARKRAQIIADTRQWCSQPRHGGATLNGLDALCGKRRVGL